MHDKISIAFENNELSIGVFFDLAKAFDTVNNDILLYELATYGVRGIQLKWFESYIQISLHRKLRNMCVCVPYWVFHLLPHSIGLHYTTNLLNIISHNYCNLI